MRLKEPIDFLAPGTPVDQTNCEREPIHTPGAIQPHGVLLAADLDELTVVQASANAGELFDRGHDDVVGAHLGDLIGKEAFDELGRRATGAEAPNLRPLRSAIGGRAVELFAYRLERLLVVDIEFADTDVPSFETYQEEVTASLAALNDASGSEEVLETAARIVRRLTDFDRVWAYRFQPDGHGVVVAEEKDERLPAFLGLHYPASDIPPQARALFLENRLRLIADVDAEPVPLDPLENPVTGGWLDLSGSVLRAVSPIHIRYLRNMGATASMSIALSVDGELWGLISAHHYSGPRLLSHQSRAACEFVGLVASMQLATHEQLEQSRYRLALEHHQRRTLDAVAGAPRMIDGLAAAEADLLAVCGAAGAAIRVGGELKLCGATPPADSVLALLADLGRREGPEIFCTDSLAREFPDHASIGDSASGVIAAPLSRQRGSWIVWFRTEWVHTVRWGDTETPLEREPDGSLRLAPRQSFEKWKQTVEATSRPWHRAEVEAAEGLRAGIGTFLLERAEQLAALNAELARSNAELDAFAYLAAHDLKEPLRGIHNYATFTLEDYHDTLDGEGRERLATILKLVERMADLLDSLLEYSRIGRAELDIVPVTVGELVEDARELLQTRIADARANLVVAQGDTRLRGDRERLRHLLVNLIANAIKYNDAPQPEIEIGAVPLADTRRGESIVQPSDDGEALAVYVRDNGIGVAPEHADDVFRLFRRLHVREAYGGGTGAGLTIARRIVERHGGALWLDESEPGAGSCFAFTLEPG